jgi:hypothetical protein
MTAAARVEGNAPPLPTLTPGSEEGAVRVAHSTPTAPASTKMITKAISQRVVKFIARSKEGESKPDAVLLRLSASDRRQQERSRLPRFINGAGGEEFRTQFTERGVVSATTGH